VARRRRGGRGPRRLPATRFFLISAANIGPNRFHQNRIVSWLMSIPRSANRSSTFRSDSGYFTYIITTRRMTSGELLKYRNGLFMAQANQPEADRQTWSDNAMALNPRSATSQRIARQDPLGNGGNRYHPMTCRAAIGQEENRAARSWRSACRKRHQ
jgi:hypothetical protein